MTWDEMLAKLRKGGVPQEMLPVRGSAEARYGLKEQGGRFVVTVMERAMTDDIADFPTEESAVSFIYDLEVIDFGLNGDTRLEKWRANREAFPLPRAEDFGGRTLY